MLRTSGSRGADKMDVLALVRAKECQPVASDDFMDFLGRTAKNELALVLGCAGVGYTQHAGKPEQPCENLSFHFAPHSYLQLGAETCGQGFAETIVEQPRWRAVQQRSEEHTSELQSLAYLVCRLLLEKKKNTMN